MISLRTKIKLHEIIVLQTGRNVNLTRVSQGSIEVFYFIIMFNKRSISLLHELFF